jgi:hypothetical protein
MRFIILIFLVFASCQKKELTLQEKLNQLSQSPAVITKTGLQRIEYYRLHHRFSKDKTVEYVEYLKKDGKAVKYIYKLIKKGMTSQQIINTLGKPLLVEGDCLTYQTGFGYTAFHMIDGRYSKISFPRLSFF